MERRICIIIWSVGAWSIGAWIVKYTNPCLTTKTLRNHFCNFSKQRKFLLNANIILLHNQIVPLRNSCLIIYNIYEETFFFFGNVRLFSSYGVRNKMAVQSPYTEVIGYSLAGFLAVNVEEISWRERLPHT